MTKFQMISERRNLTSYKPDILFFNVGVLVRIQSENIHTLDLGQ